MAWDFVDLLADLIRIPSVNPMGKPVFDAPFGEMRLSQFLHERFLELGLPVERQLAEPGRENVVARLDGSVPLQQGGRSLLIDVHQDTVDVTGMTIDPFDPKIEDGRVFGRGACDVKGSLAVVLSVISELAEQRPPQMPTIYVACTVNEENGFSGARCLVESWTGGKSALITHPPDAVVVAEPTDLNVVVAHKGVVRWRCHAAGRAAHSSRPESGDNAIYRMARVVGALERYADQLARVGEPHPRLGRPTLSVGTIQGGVGVNTVPDLCSIEIDRRLLPHEEPTTAFQELQRYLARTIEPGDQPRHDEPFLIGHGLADKNNGPLATRLEQIAVQLGIPCRRIGVAYGTDASPISEAGIPTVVFGPGSIQQAHTADEWIAITQLEQAAAVLRQFCRTIRCNPFRHVWP